MKKAKDYIHRIDKYLQCSFMGIKSQYSYRGIISDRVLSFVLQFIILYFFWQAIYINKTTIGNRNFEEMIMYVVLSISISALFIYPSIYFMSQEIKTGNVVYVLIKPINYQLQFMAKHFGIFLCMLSIIAPIFIIFSICISNIIIPSNIIYFAISLILGLATVGAFNFILGAICFWTESSDGVGYLKAIIIELFSGALIPLDFFPSFLRKIANILPFKGIVYTPITVFQYKYTINEFLGQVLFQIIWIGIFMIIGKLIFNKAQKIVMINGG